MLAPFSDEVKFSKKGLCGGPLSEYGCAVEDVAVDVVESAAHGPVNGSVAVALG